SLVSIYPFCMVVIFSELTKSRESKSLPGTFLLMFPWVTAVLVSFPVYWTYNYVQERNGGSCARVPVGTFNLNHVLTSLPSSCPIVEKPDKIVGISFSVVFLVQTIFQPFLYFITVFDTPLCDYIQNIMSVLISEESGVE
ncbi:hypothetical protein Fcan01_26963, partial [Folsomia candida]